jgi:hypothetical protein
MLDYLVDITKHTVPLAFERLLVHGTDTDTSIVANKDKKLFLNAKTNAQLMTLRDRLASQT